MARLETTKFEIDIYHDDEEDGEYLDEEYLDLEDDDSESLDSVSQIIKCNICREEVIRSALQEHMEDSHFSHKCPKCDRKYYTEAQLRRHLRCAHLESMQLKCPFCSVVLKTKYNLQQHLFTHSSQAHFKCPYENCNKSFKHVNTLKQHEKIHKKRNRRECPICHEHVTKLQSHILVHTGERPYACDLCERGYLTKQQLNVHRTSHLQDGYVCEICNLNYKSVGSLYKHQKSIHSNAKYECSECGKTYNRRDNMISHMKKTHGEPGSVGGTTRREDEI